MRGHCIDCRCDDCVRAREALEEVDDMDQAYELAVELERELAMEECRNG